MQLKLFLFVIISLVSFFSFGQSKLPLFLVGTWKVNHAERFEHWDQLNDSIMKGFSYQIKNGQMYVSEYLEITQDKYGVTYNAIVLNQNQGKNISFKMIEKKQAFTFENQDHDFPKQLIYLKLSDKLVQINISDLKQKTIHYQMVKQDTGL